MWIQSASAPGLFILFLAMAGAPAYSATVTKSFVAMISYSSSPQYLIGDTFEWTVTYDNAGTQGHGFGDGADGLAHTSDDVVNVTYYVADYVAQGYTLFSDAVFSLPSIDYVGPPYNLYDAYSSLAVADGFGTRQWFQIFEDELTFLSFFDPNQPTRGIWFHHFAAPTDTGYSYNYVEFDSVAMSEVPLPGSLELLGIGLAGLGSVRRKIGQYECHSNARSRTND